MPDETNKKRKTKMKKATFAILTVGMAVLASCGGNNAEAEKARQDSIARAKEDSIQAAQAAEAAAEAAVADTVVVDSAAAATSAQ